MAMPILLSCALEDRHTEMPGGWEAAAIIGMGVYGGTCGGEWGGAKGKCTAHKVSENKRSMTGEICATSAWCVFSYNFRIFAFSYQSQANQKHAYT